jgi:Plasmid pRiA4b ORF-3-like protein
VTAPPSVPVTPGLAEAALSCEPMARALRLAEWVGPGRQLTASGVLRPADAAQACRELGIAIPASRLRSALDVRELMRAWMTAALAGFLEIRGRRVRAAPDLPAPGASPPPGPQAILGAWIRAASVLLDVAEEPCAGCLMVLHELHTHAGPVSWKRLASAIQGVEAPEEPDGEPCPDCGEVHDPDILSGLDELQMDELHGEQNRDDQLDDGLEHSAEAVIGLVEFGAAQGDDQTVHLTPLGALLAAWVFEGNAPPPEASAGDLVSRVCELPPPAARTMARPWLEARTAEAAGRELLGFADSAAGAGRATALYLAREPGPGAWREWAARPGLGAYPRQWLSAHGEAAAQRPADEAWLTVDALAMMADTLTGALPPYLIGAALARQLGGPGDVAAMARRSDHPRAAEILALLGVSPAALARAGRVCQLRITLRWVSDPPVWRRVLVPADATLRQLHDVIQLTMGWADYHLHVFAKGKQRYGVPDPDLGYADDRAARVSQVLPRRGSRLSYTYDVGDWWEHEIVLEESRPADPGEVYPSCTAGGGACPPEDCGGPGGYARLKEILADPAHEEYAGRIEWMGLSSGAGFDPADFSAAVASARLRLLATPRGPAGRG